MTILSIRNFISQGNKRKHNNKIAQNIGFLIRFEGFLFYTMYNKYVIMYPQVRYLLYIVMEVLYVLYNYIESGY